MVKKMPTTETVEVKSADLNTTTFTNGTDAASVTIRGARVEGAGFVKINYGVLEMPRETLDTYKEVNTN